MALQDVDFIGDVTFKVRVRIPDQDPEEVTTQEMYAAVKARIVDALGDIVNGDIYNATVTGEQALLWDELE